MWKPALALLTVLSVSVVVLLSLGPDRAFGHLTEWLQLKQKIQIRLVERSSGKPVGGVTVEAYDGSEDKASTVVDRSGYGSLKIPRGQYRLVINPKTLPNGLIGPTRPELSVPYKEHRRCWNESPGVTVGAAPLKDIVTLYVHRGATISGRVTASDPMLLSNTEVRLTAVARKDPSIYARTSVDSGGEYMALVHPTTYRIQPRYLDGETGPALPAPRLLRVEPGSKHVVDFALKSGECGLSCTLEDPALLPGETLQRWDNVRARLYAEDVWIHADQEALVRTPTSYDAVVTTATDADGRLAIDGLPTGKYRLQFAADQFTPSQRGERFGAWIEPVDFELKVPGMTDLGAVRALRERPCEVTLRIHSSSLDPGSLDVALQYPAIDGASRDSYVRKLEIPAGGVIQTFVHTSPDSDLSKLMLREKGSAEWERVMELLTPPLDRVEQSVTFH